MLIGKPPNKRVDWTKEEVAKVADAVFKLRRESPKMSVMVAARSAQQFVLPPNRQRAYLTTAESVARVARTVAVLEQAAKAEARKAAAEAAKAAKAVEAEGLELVKAAKAAEAKAAEPAPPAPEPDTGPAAEPPPAGECPPRPMDWDSSALVTAAAIGLERVLVETMKRFLTNPEVAPILNSLFMRTLPDIRTEHAPRPKHNPAPSSGPQEPDRRPLVLVCGVKPHQQAYVQSSVGDTLRLKFWHDGGQGNVGLQMLKEKARGADVALFSMDGSSHTHVAAAESLGKRIVRVTGSVASVNAALAAIAVEGRQSSGGAA